MSNNGQNRNQPPPDDQERRLANPVAAQLANAREVIDAIKELDPDLATRVIAILAGAPADKPLPVDKAFAAANYEQKTGHIVGRDFYVDAKLGNVASVRGIEKDVAATSGAYTLTFRVLRNEEIAEINPSLTPGDEAMACEITQLSVYKEVLQIQALEKQLTGQITTRYVPIVGIGVLRERERYKCTRWDDNARRTVTLPREQWQPLDLGPNFSWDKKVRIRAKRDALKKVPGFAATTREVLEEAERDGIDVSLPEGANLRFDQAHEFVEGRRQEAERRAAWAAMTPEEQETEKQRRAAEFKAMQHREDLERLAYDWAMAGGPCPSCQAPHAGKNDQAQAHTAGCELRPLYPNAPVWEPAPVSNTSDPTPADPAFDAESDALFGALPSASAERATNDPAQTTLFPAGDPAQPPTTAPAAATEGSPRSGTTKSLRPYDHAGLRNAVASIVDWAEKNPDMAKVNGTFGAALAILDKVCKPIGGNHRLVIEALWQVDSATDLTAPQKCALTNWVDPFKDRESKEWIPQQHLTAECEALLGEKLTPSDVAV